MQTMYFALGCNTFVHIVCLTSEMFNIWESQVKERPFACG